MQALKVFKASWAIEILSEHIAPFKALIRQRVYFAVRSIFRGALRMLQGEKTSKSEQKSSQSHLQVFSCCPIGWIETRSLCDGEDKVQVSKWQSSVSSELLITYRNLVCNSPPTHCLFAREKEKRLLLFTNKVHQCTCYTASTSCQSFTPTSSLIVECDMRWSTMWRNVYITFLLVSFFHQSNFWWS